jgi:CheY-like chemotaxis protein
MLGASLEHMPLVLQGVTVLVVEDHSASARMTAALLAAASAQVRTVGTAEAALSLLETFLPRVVVVDLVLPGIGGIELVTMLKANDRTRDIVCVAVTVINGHDLEQAARNAGCADYLRKPLDTDTFASTIAKHLRG